MVESRAPQTLFQALFQALFRGFLWSSLLTINVLFALWFRTGLTTSYLVQTLLLFFVTGLIAYPCANYCARYLTRRKVFEARYAAHILLLAFFAIGFSASAYSLDYWHFYSQWHAPVFSITWMFQFVFTNLGALYQFGITGLRLLLPFGPILLLIFAYMEAKER